MSSIVNINELFDLSINKYSWESDLIVIAGPTCVGKSNIAVALAKKINGAIINGDSVQVYKDIALLSARPTTDEMQGIPHFLYGYVNSKRSYSVTDWLFQIKIKLIEIKKLQKIPILVGGTGLYLNAVINGLVPIPVISKQNKEATLLKFDQIGIDKFTKLVIEIDPVYSQKNNDKHRLLRAYSIYLETGKSISYWHGLPREKNINKKIYSFLINADRQSLYEKCDKRFNDMLFKGGLDEVKYLYNQNIDRSLPVSKSLGVKWLLSYLDNDITYEDAVRLSIRDTRRYVKRQITWFKHNYIPYKTILM